MRTKSQKVAAALLGLAVVAFCVDRWVLGGPGDEVEADDAAVSSDAPTRSAAARKSVALDRQAVPTTTGVAPAVHKPTSLASRLAAMDEAMRLTRAAVADAFQPPAAWVAANAPPVVAPPAPAVVAPPKPAPPKVDHAAVFAKRYTLTAVMNDGKRGMAIVNGKLFAVGQSVGGFKLIDVGLTEAVFLGKGTEVTLKLAGQSLSGVAGVQ